MNEPRLGLKRIASNSALTLGRQGLGAVFQLCTVALIAQHFGPEGNGVYAVSLILPALLAALLNFGLAPANIYYLGTGQVDIRSVLVAMALIAAANTSVGLAVGLVLIVWFGDILFPGLPTFALYAALSAFPFALSQALLASIFRGVRDYKTFNAMLIATPGVTAAWVLGVVLCGINHVGLLVIGYVVGSAIAVLIGVAGIVRLPAAESKGHADLSYAKRALKYGYKAQLGDLTNLLVYKSDIFLINLILGSASAGIYVIALQIAERLWIISRAVSTVALPELSSLHENQSVRDQLTPIMSRVVIFQTLIAGIALAIAAYLLVPVIFGSEYRLSLLPLVILLPGVIAWAGARVIANDIYARGKPSINMLFAAITAIVNVCANLALILWFGIVGAAIATSASYVLYMLMNAALLARWNNIRISESIFVNRSDIARAKKFLGRSGASV